MFKLKKVTAPNHNAIEVAISALDSVSLDESIINQHISPLFSKSLQNTPAIYLANHSLELNQVGVICDSRENLLRLCPDLLNTEEELAIVINQLSKIWRTLQL